jgi:hypothetical protein
MTGRIKIVMGYLLRALPLGTIAGDARTIPGLD